MTRRAWRLLVCGLVLVAAVAAGSVVLASRSSGEVAGPQISATLPDLSPTQWKTVKARLARRGFDRRNALIVGSSSMERPPFVLVAATPGGGRACFFAARGVRLGPATCPGRTSVVAFTLAIDSHTEVVAAVAGRSIVKFALAGRTGCGLGLLPPNVWNAVSFEGMFILDQGAITGFCAGTTPRDASSHSPSSPSRHPPCPLCIRPSPVRFRSIRGRTRSRGASPRARHQTA